MTHILHTSTVHKTASLVDEVNSAYCQSSSAHNITHYLWKLALRVGINMMSKRGIELATFCSRERCLNRSATAPDIGIDLNLFYLFLRRIGSVRINIIKTIMQNFIISNQRSVTIYQPRSQDYLPRFGRTSSAVLLPRRFDRISVSSPGNEVDYLL